MNKSIPKIYRAKGDNKEVMAIVDGIKLNGEVMGVGVKCKLQNGAVFSGFTDLDSEIRVFDNGKEIL